MAVAAWSSDGAIVHHTQALGGQRPRVARAKSRVQHGPAGRSINNTWSGGWTRQSSRKIDTRAWWSLSARVRCAADGPSRVRPPRSSLGAEAVVRGWKRARRGPSAGPRRVRWAIAQPAGRGGWPGATPDQDAVLCVDRDHASRRAGGGPRTGPVAER